MPNLFDPGKLDRIRADEAADRFEITEDEFCLLVAASEWQREDWMWRRLREFDDARRPIIGVRGSLGGSGEAAFWADWDANKDANMQRGWDALDRAGNLFAPREVAA